MIFEWGVSGEGLIQSTSNSYISEKQEKSYFPWREHKRLHFAFAPADTSALMFSHGGNIWKMEKHKRNVWN